LRRLGSSLWGLGGAFIASRKARFMRSMASGSISICFSGDFFMRDPFRDPKRRIASAKNKIKDLDAGVQAFLAKKPYARVVDTDPDTGNKTHKVKLVLAFPDDLLDLADEIAEALRSALDKAGYAAAADSGNRRLKSTYFPIADTDAELETAVIGRGRCKDLPDEILTLFRSFKPYKAGNPLIWGVNQIANGAKHRILTPVGISLGNAFMESFRNPGLTVELSFPPRWDAEKDEMVLCIVGPDAEPQYDMRFEMTVQMPPIAGLPRGPAVGVFGAMAREVENVLLATEAQMTLTRINRKN
jgi:hypothetical protein